MRRRDTTRTMLDDRRCDATRARRLTCISLLEGGLGAGRVVVGEVGLVGDVIGIHDVRVGAGVREAEAVADLVERDGQEGEGARPRVGRALEQPRLRVVEREAARVGLGERAAGAVEAALRVERRPGDGDVGAVGDALERDPARGAPLVERAAELVEQSRAVEVARRGPDRVPVVPGASARGSKKRRRRADVILARPA